ncbi:MAG: hypothetical protein PHP08_01845 [Candidatus Dojkabacteria bacterium]|nr:hypothetical protein [Candidatus Dojkabacteria bacterium]
MINDLKILGNKILYEEGLYDILSKLGHLQIVGSYDLDLLVKPDIDISVSVDEYNIEKYFSVCKEIAQNIKPIRMKYIDQSVAQFSEFPFDTGYFLGINLERNNIKWSIDVWLFKEGIFKERVAYHNSIKEKINEINRGIIIEIKSSIYKNPNYRSVDLYESVLFDNVKSLEDFHKWYEKKYSKSFLDSVS